MDVWVLIIEIQVKLSSGGSAQKSQCKRKEPVRGRESRFSPD